MFFFFNDTATTEIYTLSLHDALPISAAAMRRMARCITARREASAAVPFPRAFGRISTFQVDRKSTRLNSSHGYISYAVFCLKKKKRSLRVCKVLIRVGVLLGRYSRYL